MIHSRLARSTALLVTLLAASLPAQEKVDVSTIERIKTEETQRSQVMDIMSWLTDVHGPRLTGSPITKMAGEWAVTTMKSWGLANPHLETWGPFGRGWTNERFSFQATAPHAFIIQAVPRAWSPSSKGKVTGAATTIKADSFADLKQYAGKLKGKFLLVGPAPVVNAHFTAEGARLTDARLDTMAAAVPPDPAGGRGGRGGGGRGGAAPQFNVSRDTAALRWLEKEGLGAILLPARGDGGTIFTDNGSSRNKDAAQVPFVHVGAESYGRIMRMLERNVPVTLEMDMQNKFYDDDPNSFNVIAEIPGTDPRLKDEVVMIGAHFDSWHGGTGATDNAAGSAVMMEAMRLLKTLNVQPRRTIRIGLWTGEEEGLFGSRAYVKQHFGTADSTGLHATPEQAKFAAYFNVDNGTGKIRGVYEQGNAAVGPIFTAWMAPFKDMGMKTVTISNTGGTDHLSFDAVGLPGFQFIQDPIEYGSRTHHSNADVYERIQPEDMRFNSAVLASFAWQAAQRDEKLPRKAAPAARVVP
jgi:carboxypeptidase Q